MWKSDQSKDLILRALRVLLTLLAWCSWTTGKRLIGVLNAALILSDSQYEGWQPGKEDLLDIQSGLLCFVDKYGRLSLKEGQWFEEDEERETGLTSFENTPSPRSVPSVERSISETSTSDPSSWSPGSTEGAAPVRTSPHTAAAKEVTHPEHVPGPIEFTEPLKASVPASVRPGGPPPPQGRFFHNPVNIRTLMTGSGDGYRSPEPPSRLDSLSPLRHPYRERETLGGGPTNTGFHLSGMAAEQTGPPFCVRQPVVTQSPNDSVLGMGCGYGSWPPFSSSSVLPAELMVYNDLMMDLGTGQYLGTERQDLGLPASVHPPISANDGGGVNGFGMNEYQWQGLTVEELPQTVSPYGSYPQPDHASGQKPGTSFGAQWPTGGTVDYK